MSLDFLLFAARQVALACDGIERDAVDTHGGKPPAGVERYVFEAAVLANQLQAFKNLSVILDDLAFPETD